MDSRTLANLRKKYPFTKKQTAVGVAGVGLFGALAYYLFVYESEPDRVWPVLPYRGILSGFKSSRPPTSSEPEKGPRIHAGVDLTANKGDKIVAIADGEVIGMVTGYAIGAGLQAVSIRHKDADYIYGEIMVHNLKPGDKVKAGQVIGHVELNSDGRSMLHLEAWKTGTVPRAFTPWFTSNPMPVNLLEVQKMLPPPPEKKA